MSQQATALLTRPASEAADREPVARPSDPHRQRRERRRLAAVEAAWLAALR